MKVAFIHDFPIVKNNNNFYSTGFPYTIWQRYLEVFDHLIVVSRLSTEKNSDAPLSSGTNVTFQTIENYSSITSLFRNFKDIRNNLEKIIDESDGIIVRLPSILGFIAIEMCIKKRKKYCVEVVGSAFQAFWYHSLKGKCFAIIAEKIQKKAVKYSAVAIYITESYLQIEYPSLGYMYGKVSNVTINSSINRNEIRSENDEIRIGLVGSTFVRYKGHLTALEVINKLKKQGYTIKLSLVGQGPSKYLKELINKMKLENQVECLGIINNKNDMNNWYKSLDFYIQPSLTEGHGRAVVEAIDNGVPVFASNVGGLPDSVEKQYLFNKGDNFELERLLIKAIEQPDFALRNVVDNSKKIKKYQREIVEKRRKIALNKYKQLIKEY